ncbi:hypothetical protein OOK36_43690 [Streptomyces sp. NBC_00365]|uniref:hypothetical protein n=1 Tax=Streptomyces sp. NBC_00365 TaxID=2975726 RepID=UPI00225ACB88|nr:hypothetical protein [Streptomyces sp. NBC_00365]MCX5095626.1 hypothetical protein [Streptomyces sp. NBC_00365]
MSLRYFTHAYEDRARHSRIQKGERKFLYLLTCEDPKAEAVSSEIGGCGRTAVAVSGDTDTDTDTERQLQRSAREALTRSISGPDLGLTGIDFRILPRTTERTRRMG